MIPFCEGCVLLLSCLQAFLNLYLNSLSSLDKVEKHLSTSMEDISQEVQSLSILSESFELKSDRCRHKFGNASLEFSFTCGLSGQHTWSVREKEVAKTDQTRTELFVTVRMSRFDRTDIENIPYIVLQLKGAFRIH